MYKEFEEVGDRGQAFSELASKYNLPYKPGWGSRAAELLLDSDMIVYDSVVDSPEGAESTFKFSKEGLLRAERLMDEEPELFEEVQSSQSAPGKVLRFNIESSAHKEAVSALNELSEKVQQTNNYEEFADDKEMRVGELQAGKRMLVSGEAREEALQALLVKCLKYFAEKFTDHAIGELAKTTLTKLLALISGS